MAAAHDILVGVHGNGLTSALWMRPGSLSLEIFPEGVHHYDYQFFAELCDLDYFGFKGENVFPAFGRSGPPYGHTPFADKSVNVVPIQSIHYLLEQRAETLINRNIAQKLCGARRSQKVDDEG